MPSIKHLNSETRMGLDPLLKIGAEFIALAQSTGKHTDTIRGRKSRKRRAENYRLAAGPQTLLWNALVDAIIPHLRTYGSKAALGRRIGVPRQRIHQYFVRPTMCPNGEHALRLLAFLAELRLPSARDFKGLTSAPTRDSQDSRTRSDKSGAGF